MEREADRIETPPRNGLRGLRIVFTRPADDAGALRELAARWGAIPVEYPVLTLRPVTGDEEARLREALGELDGGRYTAAIFTSQTAVRVAAPLLPGRGLAGGVEVFAVGKKTAAAAAELGARPKVPARSSAEDLLTVVRAHHPDVAGLSFLFLRARAGRLAVIRGLEAAGARVDALPAYDTLPVQPLEPLQGDIDWLTFMSPSAVTAFLAGTSVAAGVRVACIGPTTAAVVRAAGLRVDAVAQEQSVEGMLAAMARA